MNEKFIVITTIQQPTEATEKFCSFQDWNVVIVGDLKTPKEDYKKLNCTYLDIEDQEKINKDLSDEIGFNSIQRRNMGFIFAHNEGCNILASVDDDNIPYDNWGEEVYIGETIEADYYLTEQEVFDPLSVTKRNDLWHRGFPIQLLESKNEVKLSGKKPIEVLIQADLWDGDPDIDAICRLSKKPIVQYEITNPYTSNKISPFNSQNTFFHRKVIPFYMVLPFVGRMDDIWGGYILQKKFPESLIFNKSTVYQERNPQDLITNLEKEIIGYRNTLDFLNNKYVLNEKTQKCYDLYKNSFN